MSAGPIKEAARMILSEPGSRIEGDTVEVLRTLYAVVTQLLEDSGTTPRGAEDQALRFTARAYDRLAAAGMIVRDVHDA